MADGQDYRFEDSIAHFERVNDLWRIWKQYYSMSVWKNEHIAVPLFLNILGCYFTNRKVRLLYSGRYNTLRINPFFVQNSGSGKSEAMKAAHFLLRHLGLRGDYLLKATDASLVGTIDGDIEDPHFSNGVLAYYDYLFWDEGSILLRNVPNSEMLQDVVQMTTDEPGWITKLLRLGKLEYPTYTSICAGSYFDDTINKTIFRRGLFQRMLITYHDVSYDEIEDFNRNKGQMIRANYEDKKVLMNEIGNKLAEIKPEERFNKGSDCAYLKIDEVAVSILCNNIADKTRKARGLYEPEDVRSEIMGTFLARSNQAMHVGAIIAAAEGKKDVGEQELEIGYQEYCKHLRSVNEILLYKSKATYLGGTKRFEIINEILHAHPDGLLMTELVKLLAADKRFEAGINNARSVLDTYIRDGTLVVEHTEKGGKRIKLASKAGGGG